MTRSRIINCHFEFRPSEKRPLLEETEDGSFFVNMVGYAILPKEQYERILFLAEIGAKQVADAAIRRANGAPAQDSPKTTP